MSLFCITVSALCLCVHVFKGTGVCMQMQARSQSPVVFLRNHLPFVETGTQGLDNQVRLASKLEVTSCLFLPSIGITNVCPHAWLFTWVQGLNSGSCDFPASTLPIELPPQPTITVWFLSQWQWLYKEFYSMSFSIISVLPPYIPAKAHFIIDLL